MLSNERKRQRSEERCAEMKLRLYLLPAPSVLAKQAERKAAARKRKEHERAVEEWKFTRIGRFLDAEARATAEERYVTAVWGVRTSWQRIERAALYFVWRSKAGLATRRYLSSRPAWRHVHHLDRHHVASKVVPIRPPLVVPLVPSKRAA